MDQQSANDNNELKKAVYEYCCGFPDMEQADESQYNEEDIIPELMPVWNAFKKTGFCLSRFMEEKDYNLIEDEERRVQVLMTVFLTPNLPIRCFTTDWINGYLDFLEREPDIKRCDIGMFGNDIITDTDVLVALYHCTTEQEIWALMSKGIGNIRYLYRWYKGIVKTYYIDGLGEMKCYNEKDEDKASDFLEYLLSDKTESTQSVRKEAKLLKKLGRVVDLISGSTSIQTMQYVC